ncbi:class I SAM-dependent methyltransferase [Salipaludibacillus agaradhaerens]|uniref:class I SAM-dependent methyltransferase n=1 Tax=Salipaludibacillus agaradhaerens TaxID=76935 RepID=UPI0021515F0D|nr:class I SAM-dependent methyltransferase [Salipaludibacillus agaradhaerens]MCR6106479.1 class I SAM-dependent methyltransferase [Salipaludibacillus agaradhaerens]MCR6118512.1 class I SAM-dependent methyltransferase [Salipaludibacillus agaradhaerens]
MSEFNRMLQARKWMKTNENFLSTWHAHVGYTLDLFYYFSKYRSVEHVAETCDFNRALLNRWIEVGLEIGHLKKSMTGKVKAKRKLIKYASANSPESVGVLLREMMELHLPTLLKYPDLLKNNERIEYLEDSFANVVAETSTLLEKVSISPILKIVKKNKPATIIDLGCGYGGYLKRIQKRFPTIALNGVEINDKVAKQARDALNEQAQIHCTDMETFIEKYIGKTDMVMVHNLLYYFAPEERAELFKKIASIMNQGGIITFIQPVKGAKHGQTFTAAFNTFMTAHKNLYPLPTLKEMKRNSKKAGLKIMTIKPLIREGGWYLVTMRKQFNRLTT